MPAFSAASAIGSAPRTGRTSPERESSPITAASGGSGLACPEAMRMPSRIGRSYTVPAFFRSAGAKFTVTRLTGKSRPQFFTEARTRSRASFTAASGRPTRSNCGSPPERKISAETS